MDFNATLKKYAELIVRGGCCLRQGQQLYITAPVCCAEFTRMVAESGYQAGAGQVTVRWTDERITRLGYDHCSLETFQTCPEWLAVLQNTMAEKDAAILTIDASDPGAMAGIDVRKPAALSKASHEACKAFYDRLNLGKNTWCIVAAASPAWAKKVFPGLPEDEAVARLWEYIFRAVRADEENPIAAWEEHRRSFEARKALLNQKQFDRLRYQNDLGTDITIGLPDQHEWAGGGAETVDGHPFFPNMPTEELFCSPDANRADGTVFSALPLNYQGNLIEGFSITFAKGRITNFHAQKGEDALREIISADEGSHHLGEAALIPKKSPISEMNTIFYNTLYDENASCHFAIGRGFAECIQGGYQMNKEQLAAAGINDSVVHVDFMLGTPDLKITGIQKDGKETPIFENGNWSAEFLNAK